MYSIQIVIFSSHLDVTNDCRPGFQSSPLSRERLETILRAEEKTLPEENYDFVEKPSDIFFCPILSGLLLQPHLTTCCGIHLSEEAASITKGLYQPCPFCQQQEWESILDKSFVRQVRELTVFCGNRNRGCGWVGELSGLEDHLECCRKINSPLIGHQTQLGIYNRQVQFTHCTFQCAV